MPDYAFGGDDDSSAAPPIEKKKKKLGLEKFGLSPDKNIRDEFWEIMASYSTTKKAPLDINKYDNDRFTLTRVALSVLTSEHSITHFGLPPKFIIRYMLMLLLDTEWQDCFIEFVERIGEKNPERTKRVAFWLKKLIIEDNYKSKISKIMIDMLRDRSINQIALKYLPLIKSEKLITELKKELLIFARGDIGENQLNAIDAISILKEDDEVKRTLIILLSHWDNGARKLAAAYLKNFKKDEEVKKAAASRLPIESDEETKKLLQRLTK
ncbi:MAG: hypothetical protein ACP5N9_04520 [Candidatus Bilamarchaeum sp.]|jgi:hypothetical protein